jgi:hypothetical protein
MNFQTGFGFFRGVSYVFDVFDYGDRSLRRWLHYFSSDYALSSSDSKGIAEIKKKKKKTKVVEHLCCKK